MRLPGSSMGMGFLWESHGKRPMGWDGTGINCYGMGMGQINKSHGQPWRLQRNDTFTSRHLRSWKQFSNWE